MAKKSDTTKGSFRAIMSDIRKGEFAPIYLLMGEEPYYIDSLTAALEANVVKDDEEREFNFTTVYGQEADIAQVIATCQQFPFMSERRIVLLKEGQSMQRAKDNLELLAPYVEKPNSQTVLVVVFKGGVINATSKLMKAASNSESAVVYKSVKLRDYELAGPITEYCRDKKIGIGEDAVKLLIDFIGADLWSLFGTIDKLILAGAKETGRITPELILKHVRASKEFSNFELINSIAKRDFNRCLRIISAFKSNPKNNPVVVTVGNLFAFFSKLLIAQMSGETSEAGLMKASGVKSSYAFRDYMIAMRGYKIMDTINAIHLLRELDIKSKGVESFQDEFGLLTECIFNIFSGKGPKY